MRRKTRYNFNMTLIRRVRRPLRIEENPLPIMNKRDTRICSATTTERWAISKDQGILYGQDIRIRDLPILMGCLLNLLIWLVLKNTLNVW